MNFFDVLGEMLVILFAIVAGFAARRLGWLGGETDQKLSKILLNITMPAMILAAVITGDQLPEIGVILSVLEVAVIFYALSFALALTVPRLLPGTPAQKGVWRYALSFPNVGFIGYPVAMALFGQEALFYAVVLALPFNVLSYSLGPLMLAGMARFRWKQLLSPCIVASVGALVLALTRLRPPALAGEMLDFVGSITVPLSLLVVGSFLADIPAGQVFRSAKLWLLSILRLLVLPVVLWAILRTMSTDALVMGIAVTQIAMPVAVNGTLLSMEYGGDTASMAQITFLTTLGSILTIPMIAALLL
ncbi:AEC family transporter [Dysosmobacter sp. Phy]